jgi:Tfp pilus assembly protein PilV
MDTRETNTTGNHIEGRRAAARGKALKVVVIVALVLLAGLWAWKAIQVRNVRKEAEEETQRVRQTAVNMITETRAGHLKLLAKPFVWAIRSEMLRGNMEGVNLYLQDMVRERNFQRIQVADTRGVVVASTDKKTEGKPLTGSAPTADSTLVHKVGDSAWTVTSPIMGFNSRLGTLVIDYANPKPSL